MSVQDRKERERTVMMELILEAAAQIFREEGLENLSIRKIAAKIDYSPGIIYHYFKDKDDVINNLMRKGYGRIVEGLRSVPEYEGEPEKRLKAMTYKIIDMALHIPEEYTAIQLSNSPGVLTHTSSLFKGAAKEKKALGILFMTLKEVYSDMDEYMIELTAQIIWTSTFGLIVKLIMEKNIGEEQRNNLIEHHIKCIIDGVVFGKSLNSK